MKKKKMVRIYHLPMISKKWLMKNEFKYDYNSQLYYYRFPVIKYLKTTTLEGVFTVNLDDKDLWIDVHTPYDKTPYDAFYGYEYGNYGVILKKIHSSICKQLKRMGIRASYECY